MATENKFDKLAEGSLLAACLNDSTGSVISDLVGIGVSPNTFFDPFNSRVFDAILSLDNAGHETNVISVRDHMASHGGYTADDLYLRLLDLNGNTLALSDYKRQAEIVLRYASGREVAVAGARLIGLSNDLPESVADVKSKAESILNDALDGFTDGGKMKSADCLAEETYLYLQKLMRGDIPTIDTGYPDLDNLTGGFQEGQLIILGARPSVGKSALAINIALNAVMAGTKVALFSFEMSEREIMCRITSILTGIPLSKLQPRRREGVLTSDLSDSDLAQAARCMNYVSTLPLKVGDSSAATAAHVVSRARQEMHDVQPGHGLVVVDYLQLMSSDLRTSSREVQVAELSRSMKLLAKRIHQPVLVLSQLNRSAELREDKRPILPDLRESGAIEQDADMVLFLDRCKTAEEAEQSTPQHPRPRFGTADVIIAKNRQGELGTAHLAYDAPHTKFTSLGYQD